MQATPVHHAARVQAMLRDHSAAARSSIAASWLRSARDHGLDPESSRPPQWLEEARLREARDRMAPMLRAAAPVLDRLLETVGESGCCILLTDAEGVPLERRGRAGDDASFRRWGLWTGCVWSEGAEGTNGIGTCLAEGRALTIHRDQHFYTRNTVLTCSTAPLHDHAGRLVGCLDLSSCRGDVDRGMVALLGAAVGEAARRIETAEFRQAYAGARILLASEAGPEGALLALDRDDLVIGANRAARRAFGISAEAMAAGLPAASLLSPGEAEQLDQAERGVLSRALARSGGNVSAAARLLGISRATLHRKMARMGLGPRAPRG
ncbi:helix-turn-helix domain-containing protein [Roseomonas sp. 18066]|uniref:helix-turn-helix domain-containing protein n=1 Tax=Roseomonas sp. 18066 TaxID=2681412 RepID=UPI00135B5EDC|nr:helix-turn-helix domain-containing protein [Roseomonas sp. 18066]